MHTEYFMYNLKMAIVKRRNMLLYLTQYIIHISVPTNKFVLDKYIRSNTVNGIYKLIIDNSSTKSQCH